jgi:hypothetical protein
MLDTKTCDLRPILRRTHVSIGHQNVYFARAGCRAGWQSRQMEGTLVHCIYASCASADFRECDIPVLLEKARSNNARLDITGMLLYIEGGFFQLLEGEERSVANLFATLRRDTRHSRVTQIILEPIVQRSFADWTMGFCTVAVREAAELSGENDFFTDSSCVTRLSRGRAKKLLRAFQTGSWRMDQTGVFKSSGRVA